MDFTRETLGIELPQLGTTRPPAILVGFGEKGPEIRSVSPGFRHKFDLCDGSPDIESILQLFEKDGGKAFREYLEEARSSKHVNTRFRMKTRTGTSEFKIRSNPLGQNYGIESYYVEFVDIEEQRKRGDRIKSLHKASLDLMGAKEKGEVAEIVAEIGRDELDLSYVVVRLITRGSILKPFAATGDIREEEIPNYSIEDDCPAVKAFRTGKIVYNNIKDPENRFEAKINPRSVVYTSLGNHGVIVAGRSPPQELGSSDIELLQMLASTANFAMTSLKQEDSARHVSVTELDLCAKDPEFFLADAVKETSSECRIEEAIPSSNNAEVYYLRIDSGDEREVSDAVAKMEKVKNCTVQETGEAPRLRVKTSSCTFFSKIMDIGAMVKSARLTPGELHITLRTSNEVETVKIFEVFQEQNQEWELVRKKKVKESARDLSRVREALEEKLTDKQMKALRTAYNAGYYSYPRNCTAQVVASSLGISDSTLFQHLQAAQRKLIEEYLGSLLTDLESGLSDPENT